MDLDFKHYVERRKGERDAAAREGAAYAYSGDLRVLKTLDRMRPVRLAIEALAWMPAIETASGVRTRGWVASAGGQAARWPLWGTPFSAPEILGRLA